MTSKVAPRVEGDTAGQSGDEEFGGCWSRVAAPGARWLVDQQRVAPHIDREAVAIEMVNNKIARHDCVLSTVKPARRGSTSVPTYTPNRISGRP